MLDTLRKQRDDARQAFEKLQSASDDAFDDVRAGTQKAWDAMTQSFDRAIELSLIRAISSRMSR